MQQAYFQSTRLEPALYSSEGLISTLTEVWHMQHHLKQQKEQST